MTSDIELRDVATKLNLKHSETSGSESTYYCPVHDNDTPDLDINTATDKFYCFPSGEGGKSPVTLVMHCKEIGIDEATEWLQENFPEQFGNIDKETISRRHAAREVLEYVTQLGVRRLRNKHSELYEEIQDERDLAGETLDKARVGYLSHDDMEAIKAKFDDQQLVDSGLFWENDDGYIGSHLSDRVFIPYTDASGVRFGIGAIPKSEREERSDESKYKKVIDTEYNKHILMEFQPDDDSDNLIITEGVFDTLSVLQAGYNVVSPITKKFADKDIHKLVKTAEKAGEIYLAFDGDEEGQKGQDATARELAKRGLHFVPWMMELPDGYDLDDWTSENGYTLEQLINDSQPYLDILVENANEASDNGNKIEKVDLIDEVVSIIAHWDDEIHYEDYLNDLPSRKKNLRQKVKSKQKEVSAGMEEYDSSSTPDSWEQLAFMWDDNDFSASHCASKTADFLQQHHYFKTPRDTEHIWAFNGVVYDRDGFQTIKEELYQHLDEQLSRENVRSVREQVEAKSYIDREEEKAPTEYVAVENGWLNVDTGEVEEAKPEYFITNHIPWEYDADAECPKFKEFLKQVLFPYDYESDTFREPENEEEDNRKVIQEVFGHALSREYIDKKAVMNLGPTDAGKSTLMQILIALIGNENKSSVSLQDLDEDSFASAQLHGKLLNAEADLSSARLEDPSEFKKLTGGDAISAQHKGENRFDFYNYATLVFSTNELPATNDVNDAFFNRWLLIEYPNRFTSVEGDGNPDKDTELLDSIVGDEEEMKGVLAWAVEGLKRLRENGRFTETIAQEQVKAQWLSESDPVQVFFEYVVEENPQERINKEFLYQEYETFCEGANISPLSRQKFHKRFKGKFGVEESQPRVDGKQIRVYKGVTTSDMERAIRLVNGEWPSDVVKDSEDTTDNGENRDKTDSDTGYTTSSTSPRKEIEEGKEISPQNSHNKDIETPVSAVSDSDWSFRNLDQDETDLVRFIEETSGAKASEFGHVTDETAELVADRLVEKGVLERVGDEFRLT